MIFNHIKTNRMKKITLIICSLILLFNYSCSTSKSKVFDERTSTHKRIAVLPSQSKLKLTDKQKAKLTSAEIQSAEQEQGKQVQDAVESYLAGKNLRVTIQSSGTTNSKLRNAGIDFKTIGEQDYSKLAKIVGVDAVVGGYIETQKPMDEKLAMGLNVAKGLEKTLLGSAFGSNVNTSTNNGMCRVSVFEGQQGDRLWTYTQDIEMGAGSTTQDIINNLMRRGARKFPYKN